MIVDVSCEHVSKKYRVPVARRGVLDALRAPRRDFWALRDVSFDVRRGEAFGIIGRNGAGKSTILKLLGGITVPSEGEIRISGRLAALIEIGSGFHPELTGRENAYLSGSMLGLRRRHITERLADIIEFSGIGNFIDTPVKFYSSGMYVRLGFAIAAHLKPDVLLVDEVLAVGDAEFQARCLRRIEQMKERGVTMILVSHDLGAVEQLCDRAMLLDRGTVMLSGTSHEVVTAYQRLAAGAEPATVTAPVDASGDDAPLQITGLTLRTVDGRAILTARAGEPLVAEVGLRASMPHDDVEVTLAIYDFERGTLLVECTSAANGERLPLSAGESAVEFVIPELLLAPGQYTLGATARPASAPQPTAWRYGRTTLYVDGADRRRGQFLLSYQCRVANRSTSALMS
jgi:ABC-type polysaccharide/polyol phosphate transport system ATPase subunit